MHLHALNLSGFKSFPEAKIEFPPGITAVVGPNGTGKSNIVDAILWVLGEQSVKTLRSERMEDVIFNGTASRKPVGMAEVSLILKRVPRHHLEGIIGLSGEAEEKAEADVMVTRRLFRDGESEYLLNKIPCRLKDIRSLFLSARTGSKGHTVIEQGNIEQVLSASPRERRELIEETAGIVRYKKQKAEALRKLEATQHNLVRVRDVIGEVRQQLRSLERQAKQAQVYQTLQQEARSLEIRLLVHDYRGYLAQQTEVEGQVHEVERVEAEYLAEQARLTATREEARLALESSEQDLERIREELASVEHNQAQTLTTLEVERNRLSMYDQQQNQAQDEQERLGREAEEATAYRGELAERAERLRVEREEHVRGLEDVEREAAELTRRRTDMVHERERVRGDLMTRAVELANKENGMAELGRRWEELGRRLQRLSDEQGGVSAHHAEKTARIQDVYQSRQTVQESLAEKRKALEAAARIRLTCLEGGQTAAQDLARAQEEAAAVGSQLEVLQDIMKEALGDSRADGEGPGPLRELISGMRDPIAECLEVPASLERAIEAVLGEYLRGWIVETQADACCAVTLFKEHERGRIACFPLRAARTRTKEDPGLMWWETLRSRPGVIARALDEVQAPEECRDIVTWLLQDVVIVESLEAACSLWQEGGWSTSNGPRLVTLDGDMLDGFGGIRGGSTPPMAGLLQRRREIVQLEVRRKELHTCIEELKAKKQALESEQETVETTIGELEQGIRQDELHVLALEKDAANLEHAVTETEHRLQRIDEDIVLAREEQARVGEDRRSAAASLEDLRLVHTAQEETLRVVDRTLEGLEAEHAALQQRVTDARLAEAALRERQEYTTAELVRMDKDEQQRGERMAQLAKHLIELQDAMSRCRATQEESQRRLEVLARQKGEVEDRRYHEQEVHAGHRQAVAEAEQQLAQVGERLGTVRTKRTAVEVRQAEIHTQLRTLEATLTGTYELTVEQALGRSPYASAEGSSDQEGKEGHETTKEQEMGPARGEEPVETIREQLQKIRGRIERLGPINLAAIQEHQELEERHRFLTGQEEDLTSSMGSLKEIITKINSTTRKMFHDTFEELRTKFSEVFGGFFPGGRADLVLVEDPKAGEDGEASETYEDPGVEILAEPPGKRLRTLAMLSGGEKTMTALALLFASFLTRPTPFCILDEVDAPLDEANVVRFTAFLQEIACRAQFIVITHNKRTMEVASSLFGVTMEEPGISQLVSARLADLQLIETHQAVSK